MILTKEQAENLKRLLSETGVYSEYVDELTKAIDGYEIEPGNILRQKHCSHKWHQYTQEEIRMIGIPMLLKYDNWTKEMCEAYLSEFSYCELCGLRYKYENLDMDRVTDRFKKSFRITIGVSDYDSSSAITDEYKQSQKELDKEIDTLEKHLEKLRAEIADKESRKTK